MKLPFMISDGMVFQRGVGSRLWGLADKSVSVSFAGCQYNARPDDDGKWSVDLGKLSPGGPYDLVINDVCIKDVYVGDVWLCSGQSNMQLPMSRVKHMYPDEMLCYNPYIRQFSVPQRCCPDGPVEELDGGCWVGVTPESIGDFTAVGYFFAQYLYHKYNVPIGLISTAIGGTSINAWMSKNALKEFPQLLCNKYSGMNIDVKQEEENKRLESIYAEIDSKDPGLTGQWYSLSYDDSEWDTRELLTSWDNAGSVWLRHTLEIPPGLAGKPATLFLGNITDWDTVYVNGEEVGRTTYRYPPREYHIKSLPAGRCVITVRIISNKGGCFIRGKQYLLSTNQGSFNLNGIWRYRPGVACEPIENGSLIYNIPTGLYNGMLHPTGKYNIRGMIWYQGETDTPTPERYADKFFSFTHDLRALFKQDFPIAFVELPHWGEGSNWDLLRRQQWQCLKLAKTAMAAAFDLGEHNDLHPQNKRLIGERLARCAMRIAYNETIPPSPFEIIGYKNS